MKALLDIATPAQFVEAFLDDASSGLAFSRLPLCFGVLGQENLAEGRALGCIPSCQIW